MNQPGAIANKKGLNGTQKAETRNGSVVKNRNAQKGSVASRKTNKNGWNEKHVSGWNKEL